MGIGRPLPPHAQNSSRQVLRSNRETWLPVCRAHSGGFTGAAKKAGPEGHQEKPRLQLETGVLSLSRDCSKATAQPRGALGPSSQSTLGSPGGLGVGEGGQKTWGSRGRAPTGSGWEQPRGQEGLQQVPVARSSPQTRSDQPGNNKIPSQKQTTNR